MNTTNLPVAVIGAGPIGLLTARTGRARRAGGGLRGGRRPVRRHQGRHDPDAHDSDLRARAYFDPGSVVCERLGEVAVLLRPDGHIAHLEPWTADSWHHIRNRYLQEVCLEG